jgi:hypothetical protein
VSDKRDECLEKIIEYEDKLKLRDNQIKMLQVELTASKQDINSMIRISDEFQNKYESLIQKVLQIIYFSKMRVISGRRNSS